MTVITMPDGQAVDFGNMPPAQIKALIQKKFPNFGKGAPASVPGGATPAVAEPQAPGIPPEPRNVMPSTEQGSIFEPIMQGVSAGLFDEVVGGVGGVHSLLKGEPFSEGYNRGVGTTRERTKSYAEAHPVAAPIGEAGGALATLPATGGVNLFKAGAAAPALIRGGSKAGNAALTGGAYGGAYGFGTAEGGIGNRAEGAARGADLGAGIGLVTPAATGAIGWIAQEAFGKPIAAMANYIAPRTRAQSLVRGARAKDAASAGISPQQAGRNLEMAQNAGVPMKPLDMGESTRRLGRAAANMSPQAQDTLNQTVNARFETQADRVIETVRSVAPGVQGPQKMRLLEAAAKTTNKKNYDRAYFDGAKGVWTPELEGLTVSRDFQEAIKDATRIGTNEAGVRGQRPPVNPFVKNPDGTINPIPNVRPTLEFWDHVKRSIDGQIDIQKRAGNKDYVRQLTELKGKLTGVLDNAIPSYKAAREGAYGYFSAEDAVEAGANFAKMGRGAFKEDEVTQALGKMTPAERSLFGEGYATEFINMLESVPDRNSVINRVFQSPAARRQFEIALGKGAADAMETTVRLESIMDLGRKAVQGNSTTAQQLIAQTMVGGAAGSIAGGGDWTNPTTWITAALTMGVARAGRNKIGRANEAMAREVGELLASNDPKVVQQAIARITRHPHGMDILRRAHTWLTRATLPIIQRADGGSVPAMVDSGTGSQPAQANQ
jgi:hypothetical protein